MATTVRDAFIDGPGSHVNLALNAMTGITINTSVTVGPRLFGTVEAFLPNANIRVRMIRQGAVGTFQPILRRGASVS
jgi:hypothetical protein